MMVAVNAIIIIVRMGKEPIENENCVDTLIRYVSNSSIVKICFIHIQIFYLECVQRYVLFEHIQTCFILGGSKKYIV